MENSVKSILLEAKDSCHALKELYLLFKEKQTSFSLAYICQRCAIPSKGYLGSVINGAKYLNRKYHYPIGKVFKLNLKQERVLHLLLGIDVEENQWVKTEMMEELTSARKALLTKPSGLHFTGKTAYLNAMVFASFGIIDKEFIKLEDLEKLFIKTPKTELIESLTKLKIMGHLNEIDSGYQLASNDVIFNLEDPAERKEQQLLIRDGIDFALNSLETKYAKAEESYFESSVLSIKSSELPDFLKKLRMIINERMVHIESTEGDSLLHFNIQVFKGIGG